MMVIIYDGSQWLVWSSAMTISGSLDQPSQGKNHQIIGQKWPKEVLVWIQPKKMPIKKKHGRVQMHEVASPKHPICENAWHAHQQ